MRKAYFITHPNVVIDPNVPVPEWPLSEIGRSRMFRMLEQRWVPTIQKIYSSRERKAIDGAHILADHLGLSVTLMGSLGENDRSSTGFLPGEAFEAAADSFFAHPQESYKGWETAQEAQARIVGALNKIVKESMDCRSLAIISHGAVGTLLHCHLKGRNISRKYDQPGCGGGSYFAIDLDTMTAESEWIPID